MELIWRIYQNGTFQQLNVTGRNHGIVGEPGETFVTTLSTDSSKENAYKSAYNSLQSALVQKTDVPITITDSAYDLVKSSSKANSVVSYYDNQLALHELIANYISTAVAIAGKTLTSNLNFVIEVEFSDGSTAYFKITGIDSNGGIQYSFLNGIDADGNTFDEAKSVFVKLVVAINLLCTLTLDVILFRI